MKRIIHILLLVVLTVQVTAATKGPIGFGSIKRHENTSIRSMSLKHVLKSKRNDSHTINHKCTPNFSVGLLEGKGIHLFSVSKMGPIPSMNIGAKFKIGFKITL